MKVKVYQTEYKIYDKENEAIIKGSLVGKMGKRDVANAINIPTAFVIEVRASKTYEVEIPDDVIAQYIK